MRAAKLQDLTLSCPLFLGDLQGLALNMEVAVNTGPESKPIRGETLVPDYCRCFQRQPAEKWADHLTDKGRQRENLAGQASSPTASWPTLAWKWVRRQHECRRACQATPSRTRAENYMLPQRLVKTCLLPTLGHGGGEAREDLDRHLRPH